MCLLTYSPTSFDIHISCANRFIRAVEAAHRQRRDSELDQFISSLPAMDAPISTFHATGNGANSSVVTQVVPSLPRASQSSSPLIQLPPELRLMVLRYLLLKNVPISSRRSRKRYHTVDSVQKEPTEQSCSIEQNQSSLVSGNRLTPSIMCTCQQLCMEAVPILYGESVLRINIDTDQTKARVTYRSTRANPHINTGIVAKVTILKHEHVVLRPGYRGWDQNERLKEFATRFRNFLVMVDTNLDQSSINRLRYVVHLMAPIFQTHKVEITFNVHDSTSAPISTIHMNDQDRLAKPFLLLRCSSFYFTNLIAPGVLAIRNVITSSQPVIELEQFSRVPYDILKLLSTAAQYDRYWHSEIVKLRARFTLAIENFDVPAFLQARFEVLKMWLEFERAMDSEDDEAEESFVSKERYRFRISTSCWLGLRIKAEGGFVNARLKVLKERHEVTLVLEPDT